MSLFLQIFPLERDGGSLFRVHAGSVQSVAEAQLIIVNERCASANAFPLMLNRGSCFVFCPMFEIGCGEVFKIMSSLSELTAVSSTVEQIK